MKKVLKRAKFWLLLFVFGILVDEQIKEGYFFNPSDLFNPAITHEKIIVAVLIALAILWRKGGKRL